MKKGDSVVIFTNGGFALSGLLEGGIKGSADASSWIIEKDVLLRNVRVHIGGSSLVSSWLRLRQVRVNMADIVALGS